MIYDSVYNGRYKDCIKSRGDVNDMMEYTTIQAAVDAIKEAVRTEKPNVPPPQLRLLRARKKIMLTLVMLSARIIPNRKQKPRKSTTSSLRTRSNIGIAT